MGPSPGCGEQALCAQTDPELWGPSPRVRGAASDDPAPQGVEGSIPADAGSSVVSVVAVHQTWVHPRGRREQSIAAIEKTLSRGTSPHARGVDSPAGLRDLTRGAIPARTGNRWSGLVRAGQSRDHPHTSRGAAHEAHVYEVQVGAIPARAGSRTRTSPPSAPCRDHPPDGRGAIEPGPGVVHGRGSIPARAGSRLLPAPPPWASRDHPRGHGEQVHHHAAGGGRLGPSPRKREATARHVRRVPDGGSIPRVRGEQQPSAQQFFSANGPFRGCEEQSAFCHATRASTGPSPRGQGTGGDINRAAAGEGTTLVSTGSSGARAPARGPRRDHPHAGREQIGMSW